MSAIIILVQNLLHDLRTTNDILKHNDTIGTLMLLLCNLPEQNHYIPIIASVTIQKLEMGDVDMYASFLKKAMQHLQHGLFTDTSIVYTRNQRLKYREPDLTKMETEQGLINIWSVPVFLWHDYDTFIELIHEADFLIHVVYQPGIDYNVFIRFMYHIYTIKNNKRLLTENINVHPEVMNEKK